MLFILCFYQNENVILKKMEWDMKGESANDTVLKPKGMMIEKDTLNVHEHIIISGLGQHLTTGYAVDQLSPDLG